MKSKLSVPAFALAVIALFVALSGGAVAAGIVPLARHATTAGTASNSLKLGGKTPAQLAKSLRGARGPQGIQGPAGARGPAGPAGPAGTSGAAAVTVHTQPYTLGPSADQKFVTSCGAGQKAVGGGYDSNGDPTGAVINLDLKPTAADDGWSIWLFNGDKNASHSGTVYAVCLG